MSFNPIRVLITAISKANPGVVTCATNHNLTTGQCIRFNIPKSYGMPELNNQIVQITNLSSKTFSIQYSQVPNAISVNTSGFAPFVNAGTGTPAAFVPIGSKPTPITNTKPQQLNNVCESTIDDAYTNTSTTEIPF